MSDTSLITLSRSPDGLIQGALQPDGTVALKWLDQADPSWIPFGGEGLTSAPAIVTDHKGWLWLFARGGDGAVLANLRRPELGWSGWSSIGGQGTDGPGACLDDRGRVVVFSRSADGALWSCWYEKERWSEWQSLEGQILGSPAPMLTKEGRLVVFARCIDDAVWYRYHDQSAWLSLGGVLTSAPAVAANGLGDGYVFGRGADGALWYSHDEGGWQPWASLGGGIVGAPAAATGADGALKVRAIGTDEQTIFERVGVEGWDAWTEVDRRPAPRADPHEADDALLRHIAKIVKADLVIQGLTTLVFEAIRLGAMRAVLAGAGLDGVQAGPGEETALAEWSARREPEKQKRMVALARQVLSAHGKVAGGAAELWQRVDLAAPVPIHEQLFSDRHAVSGMFDLEPVTKALREAGLLGFRPQSGLSMELHLRKVWCMQDTTGGDPAIAPKDRSTGVQYRCELIG